ncbi:MAG: serine hydrolase domain-containing protein [Hyphomonadaceae bacterium]
MRQMLVFLFLTLACTAGAVAPASAQLTRHAQDLASFEATLDEAFEKSPDFVGLGVAVVRDGRAEFMKTWGVREAGGREPVTPDTVFRLASVSKGFAATLAAMEIADGRFSLTDKVSASVPQFRLPSRKETDAVTVEHILSHRVGLPPFAYDNLLEAGTAPLEILNRYKSVRLVCPVGSCYTYQNASFDMIGTVIEKATGESFAQRLKERIFDPLGMKSASVGLSGLRATGNWARPHILKDGAWVPTPVKDAYYHVPAAAGVNASLSDLAVWLGAQTGERPDVVPEPVLETLRAPRIKTPAETRRQAALHMPVSDTGYGLGWRVMTYGGTRVIAHSGSVEGYLIQIAYIPERKSGIAILSNTRGARAAKILPTWLDMELGQPQQDWLRLADLEAAPSNNLSTPLIFTNQSAGQ